MNYLEYLDTITRIQQQQQNVFLFISILEWSMKKMYNFLVLNVNNQ